MAVPTLARTAASLLAAAGIAAAAAGCGNGSASETTIVATTTTPSTPPIPKATPVNVHRLPLGDGKYTTDGPAEEEVYSCSNSFTGTVATGTPPWIDGDTGTWNLSRKVAVEGRQRLPGQFTHQLSKDIRILSGDGLPLHPAGVFPVDPSDPAYQYDPNPNSIVSYTLRAAVPADPERAKHPTCVGEVVGVMKDGIPLFSPFDAGGQDAPAHEVEDRCYGHPNEGDQYHYHSLSRCLRVGAEANTATLVGWALDGFGIYVERDPGGTMLSSADLDRCHGRTSVVDWEGKPTRIYHYDATLDFPYAVACFRGIPIGEAEGLAIGPPGSSSSSTYPAYTTTSSYPSY
jgi:hypothetical protein